MCGRLRVGKENLHFAALVGAAMCSACFGEVAPELQKAFAGAFHISEAELVTAAKAFAQFSGESYPLAA
jgi:hypothetical protein